MALYIRGISPHGKNGITLPQQYVVNTRSQPGSHLGLVLWLCCAVDTPPFCTKAEHRVPLLFLVLPGRFCCRDLVKETFDRVPPAGTGLVLKLPALLAGRDLGWQQRGEVVLPERSVNLSRFQETLDMPCRILHTHSVGGVGIYEIRSGQKVVTGITG